MFNVGEQIVYGKKGVYVVRDVGFLKLPGIDVSRLYYTLVSTHTTETLYTPVDTSVFMRSIITREEALSLIKKIPAMEKDLAVLNVSGDELSDYYKSLIHTHDCSDLMRLIITVYFRTQQAKQSKKKIAQTEQNYMRDAEDILHEELSVALGIPKERVPMFIADMINAQT